MASLALMAFPALAVTCNQASVQAISPKYALVTSASETATGSMTYCAVNASMTTNASLGDVIHFTLDLPDPQYWNSRFLFGGNGGFAGAIPPNTSNLKAGFAVVGTDTGHTAAHIYLGTWALNNSPAVLDFEYRAVHEVAVAAEGMTTAYYDTSNYHTYFDGCSTGGRQALVEAEDYPADFNGLVAGDPGTGEAYLAFNWNEQAILVGPSSFIDNNAISLVNQAVLTQCDGLDGVVDGLIQNPSICPFQAASLQCASGQTTGCLSAGQVAAFNAIYQGPVDPAGASLYPGLSVSDPAPSAPTDPAWNSYLDQCPSTGTCVPPNYSAAEPWTNPQPTQWNSQDTFFKDFIYNSATYDTRDISFASQTQLNFITRTVASLGGEGVSPNLTSFAGLGNKLILFHGWSDPAFSPYVSVNYFNSVQAVLGAGTTNNVRLFMVPGEHHCQGVGPGPNTYGDVSALTTWVEQGVAPDGIIASHHINDDPTQPVDRTMPLCSYPEQAVYNGVGPVDDASSWYCPSS